MTDLNHLI